MRNHFTILLFLLANNFYAFSQADIYAVSQNGVRVKIDSLTRILPALKDFKRIECLNELSEAYHEIQTDTARIYAKQALKEAEKMNYVKGVAKAYRNLGRVEAHLSTDFPVMEKYFTKSLELYLKTGDEHEIAWAWFALGYSKWVLCKFPEAMDAYEKAVKVFEKEGDTVNLVEAYGNMSNAAAEWGRYEKSLQYALKCEELTGQEDYNAAGIFYTMGDYETALKYLRKTPSEGFKYLAIGSTFYKKKQYDSAIHYYQLFADFARAEGNGQLGKFDAALGEVHLTLKNYDSALIYLNRALSSHKKANDRNQVMGVLLLLGKAYKESSAYKSAIQAAAELLKMADETGARQHSRDSHLLLYELFEQSKKHDSAYTHLRQYTILKDSIDLDLSAQRLLMYKAKSEKELKAQSRIYAINEEKKMQQQELEQAALQKKMLIAGIATVLMIAVVLFRNISLKRKNENLRLEHELELQQVETEKTKAELQQQATDLEMQALRAQMSPHFIFNCLNAINGFILVNDSETAAGYLTKFSRLIRMVLNNSQRKYISLDEELETLDLYLYMEQLRFTNNFHYRINYDDTIDALSIFIPPMLLQPFAENAIWHGLMHKEENGELLIELYRENNILYCTITDNGVGREKAAMQKSKSAEKNKSMGLQITKNRMALLNQGLNDQSFFEIHDLKDASGNGAGTSVCLRIKIKESAEENVLQNM